MKTHTLARALAWHTWTRFPARRQLRRYMRRNGRDFAPIQLARARARAYAAPIQGKLATRDIYLSSPFIYVFALVVRVVHASFWQARSGQQNDDVGQTNEKQTSDRASIRCERVDVCCAMAHSNVYVRALPAATCAACEIGARARSLAQEHFHCNPLSFMPMNSLLARTNSHEAINSRLCAGQFAVVVVNLRGGALRV